jgi:peptidoglycan/LPS O-acetylase OafA/YrhL
MIVIQHSAGLFGSSKEHSVPWAQGVSFFFVLSGFILAYTYPKLETWPEIQQFWRARVARVWPTLLVTFLLSFWLLSLSWDTRTAFANLLLVHAWIPFPTYYFSYNSPSWSISTEVFFYLAFPFLIKRWDRTWLAKVLISGIVVIALILLCNTLQLPSYGSLNDGITRHALLQIHPVTRIFEFIFGIWIAFYWRNREDRTPCNKNLANLREIGAVLLVGASMYFIVPIAHSGYLTWAGPATTQWLVDSGSMFAFGLLIYVMATGGGQISAWLSNSILVLLGEISFSIYLLHQIFLRYYQSNIASFPNYSNGISLAIFWAIVLLASYLMWALVEMPCRRLILGRWGQEMHATEAMQKSWVRHLNWNRVTLTVSIVLASLLAAIYFSMGIVRLTPSEADQVTPEQLRRFAGTRFGNLFMLRGVNIVRKPEGIYVELAWESLIEQELTYTTGIHLTDESGKILDQADYKQPQSGKAEKAGTIWKDSVFLSASKLSGRDGKLAIALFEVPRNLLPIDRGDRDWGDRRLLLPIPSLGAGQGQPPRGSALMPAIDGLQFATLERPSAKLVSLVPNGPCAVDLINGMPISSGTFAVGDKANLTIEGWAGLLATGVSPTGVIVELAASDRYYISANHGIKRPDY